MKESDIEVSADSAAVGTEVHKIIVVLREDLEPWKRLNVAAFTASGVAAAPDVVGAPYRDASGSSYLPMFKEPVLIFGATAGEMRRTADRARSRDVRCSVFTEQLFDTFNDEDNRAAVAAVATSDLSIVGLAFRCEREIAYKILKGLKLLR
jgi:hypothetical protein